VTLQLAALPPCDDLFSPACDVAHPRVLVDDAQGGIRYWPRVIDTRSAQRWFELLHERANWQSMQRPMYDRIVAVPRLLAGYRVDDLPDDLPLRALLDHVQVLAPAPYTSAGLNLYRDGNDSVAMHGDTTARDMLEATVATVSLGAPRRFLLKPTEGGANAGARETVSIDPCPAACCR
jgi:alkylated DNA repair dioxygenase AlkB